ncbi:MULTISPECIES: HlyD family secretion protein [unclassified Rhizobium]|uniref:HlyD family secretion protein n=1 Tax=unclassified Rhizobium TaxID=2613769 RepID=UPI00104D079A|nr:MULTISPECIES: HlyD family secretion protein [unclassified Rhizobium]MBB3399125.1 membrane fusion protein (multidrug efflux system) [Rhizobium sp. BK060]MBB4171698.1 membrane fusion protein (multidrug efflux system) [Rhizobium sp. BK538]TCM66884.1 membrane fusion protein (multidrug efflux system) [Rhizobium sp. BK068]
MDENVIALTGKSDRKAAPAAPEAPTADAGNRPAPAAPVAAAPAAPVATERKGGGIKKLVMGVSLLAVIAGAAYYGHNYWTVGRFEVSTDDAYIKADNSAIAPKIAGYLAKVLVGDNQVVTAGDVLAVIDDRDYATALDQAKADVDAARATIEAKKAALVTQQSVIAAAHASIEVDRANETFAEQNDKRYTRLATNGYAPVQTAQQASSQIAANRATTARDIAALEGATKQVDILKAEVAQAEAALARDIAVQRQAELNLSYSKIVAPIDGVVGNRTLRVGQYVQAGTQLMTVVPTKAAYVVANYKETQLTDVRPGQEVDIEVDMFPDRVYHGRVDSLAPASGQEFALLPPDNATGNFTKVVQRIPVRIVIDAESVASGDLRPGMSVTPTIDTKVGNE